MTLTLRNRNFCVIH